ncbi:MAG: ABC transporter ATP-binding protein [Lachnospiraceae bacterium]|nr:ABC transporter ATP-binding protein [Lachnospiraceae bacterium]
MKIKPVIFDKIQTSHTSFVVDLTTDNNITFIMGDSGVGKSAVFSFLQEIAAEDKRIRCFNYLDNKKNYKTTIKKSKGKLFIIDNADVLLDDNMRHYISLDAENQYVIIGRNPTGLLLSYDELYELESTKEGNIVRFTLKKCNI